jgi:hypothetical protein
MDPNNGRVSALQLCIFCDGRVCVLMAQCILDTTMTQVLVLILRWCSISTRQP